MGHVAYVAAAYGISAFVIAGLVVWIVAGQRARKAEIEALEASGVRRRSQRAGSDSA